MKLLPDNIDGKLFNFYPLVEIKPTFPKDIHIAEIKIISLSSEN